MGKLLLSNLSHIVLFTNQIVHESADRHLVMREFVCSNMNDVYSRIPLLRPPLFTAIRQFRPNNKNAPIFFLL